MSCLVLALAQGGVSWMCVACMCEWLIVHIRLDCMRVLIGLCDCVVCFCLVNGQCGSAAQTRADLVKFRLVFESFSV